MEANHIKFIADALYDDALSPKGEPYDPESVCNRRTKLEKRWIHPDQPEIVRLDIPHPVFPLDKKSKSLRLLPVGISERYATCISGDNLEHIVPDTGQAMRSKVAQWLMSIASLAKQCSTRAQFRALFDYMKESARSSTLYVTAFQRALDIMEADFQRWQETLPEAEREEIVHFTIRGTEEEEKETHTALQVVFGRAPTGPKLIPLYGFPVSAFSSDGLEAVLHADPEKRGTTSMLDADEQHSSLTHEEKAYPVTAWKMHVALDVAEPKWRKLDLDLRVGPRGCVRQQGDLLIWASNGKLSVLDLSSTRPPVHYYWNVIELGNIVTDVAVTSYYTAVIIAATRVVFWINHLLAPKDGEPNGQCQETGFVLDASAFSSIQADPLVPRYCWVMTADGVAWCIDTEKRVNAKGLRSPALHNSATAIFGARLRGTRLMLWDTGTISTQKVRDMKKDDHSYWATTWYPTVVDADRWGTLQAVLHEQNHVSLVNIGLPANLPRREFPPPPLLAKEVPLAITAHGRGSICMFDGRLSVLYPDGTVSLFTIDTKGIPEYLPFGAPRSSDTDATSSFLPEHLRSKKQQRQKKGTLKSNTRRAKDRSSTSKQKEEA